MSYAPVHGANIGLPPRQAREASWAAAAGNGHRVLEHLYKRPIVPVNDIRELTGTTYPAANQLVDRLMKLKILLEITGQSRNRQFQYAPYVRLFNSERENESQP